MATELAPSGAHLMTAALNDTLNSDAASPHSTHTRHDGTSPPAAAGAMSKSAAAMPAHAKRMNVASVTCPRRANSKLPTRPAAPKSTSAKVIASSGRPATCWKNGSM